MTKKSGPDCCLCGLPYERFGNNPMPLAQNGRCCDACNEIVTEARINPKAMAKEIDRVKGAIARKSSSGLVAMAVAAICASRGPGLWAKTQQELAKLREQAPASTPSFRARSAGSSRASCPPRPSPQRR